MSESGPKNLRLIIPIYVIIKMNFTTSSSNYYAVCCFDGREDILWRVEEKLGASDATLGEISVVGTLRSCALGTRTAPLLCHRLESFGDDVVGASTVCCASCSAPAASQLDLVKLRSSLS